MELLFLIIKHKTFGKLNFADQSGKWSTNVFFAVINIVISTTP